ncbi:DUF6891 domain-containing protein [Streptomyces resistomycificus]|uniref:DUF6891 domain-containing protein n=1 Tax=Streptomyces resistomycificus TaxID=67356 RepID=A0A0L8LM88_9ACTN|nr:hypothetical protein [Streptomyces resistomycificus]KOG39191.1 hypothetical protein ADK37_09155 [Streptomyces resistomycificus]KUN99791.1 hypothetical protein AQJ84_10250 [Streptomyces resistomycificus]
MEIDGGLAIKVKTENRQTHTRIPAARLRELVHRIGGDDDHFLVVQRTPDRPGVFIQVAHTRGGVYEFQHRTGQVPYMWVTEVQDPDLVAGVMARWARQEADWDAGVTWRRDELAPPQEVPAPDPELAARAEEFVRRLLDDGYLGIERLVQETVYLVQDGAAEPPLSPGQARVIVERLWLERVEQQEAWSGPTDPDRLERAFAALEGEGVVAREDFTCCRSCGMAEIGAEADGRDGVRGFVFFHQQGTRAAAEGHGLSLYYGGFDDSEATTTAVGHQVVAALTAAGLSARWDGDPAKAIDVTPLNWRKRLVG